MSEELDQIQNITHEYRKSLAAYEARTGRAPGALPVRSVPCHMTRPWRGVRKPAMAASSVDLPPPDGPITAVMPGPISRFAVSTKSP